MSSSSGDEKNYNTHLAAIIATFSFANPDPNLKFSLFLPYLYFYVMRPIYVWSIPDALL